MAGKARAVGVQVTTNRNHVCWVVRRGYAVGVFDSPDKIRPLIKGYPGACHQGFEETDFAEWQFGKPGNAISTYLANDGEGQLAKISMKDRKRSRLEAQARRSAEEESASDEEMPGMQAEAKAADVAPPQAAKEE